MKRKRNETADTVDDGVGPKEISRGLATMILLKKKYIFICCGYIYIFIVDI